MQSLSFCLLTSLLPSQKYSLFKKMYDLYRFFKPGMNYNRYMANGKVNCLF